jgi:hypothetical protein
MDHAQVDVLIIAPKMLDPSEEPITDGVRPPVNPLVREMFGRRKAAEPPSGLVDRAPQLHTLPNSVDRPSRLRPILLGVAAALFSLVFVAGTRTSSEESGPPVVVDLSTLSAAQGPSVNAGAVPSVAIVGEQGGGSISVRLGETVVVKINSVAGSRYSDLEARARSISLRLEAAVEAWVSGTTGEVLATYRRDHHEVVFVRATGSFRIMDVLSVDAHSQSPADFAASVAAKVMAELESSKPTPS